MTTSAIWSNDAYIFIETVLSIGFKVSMATGKSVYKMCAWVYHAW